MALTHIAIHDLFDFADIILHYFLFSVNISEGPCIQQLLSLWSGSCIYSSRLLIFRFYKQSKFKAFLGCPRLVVVQVVFILKEFPTGVSKESLCRLSKSDNCLYYPTLLRRVQITRETSTNITRYLYSSYSPRPRERSKTLASKNYGETKTLDNKSLIRHFSV